MPWQHDDAFLARNPAGELPVWETGGGDIICGARAISEWLEDITVDNVLLPQSPLGRAEVRRLIDWFEHKFTSEVSHPLINERLIKRFAKNEAASSQIIRAALANAHIHLDYINWLVDQSAWLAGDKISLADLIAAAHLSVLDYFGDISWQRYQPAKIWYMKLKSRPSFQPLLNDLVTGLKPALGYSNPDF